MIIRAYTDEGKYIEGSANYKVLLDGIEQSLCVVANDEIGYIEKYKKDSNGELVISPNGEYIETERVYGKVLIIKIKGE